MTSLRDELSRELPPLSAPKLGLLRSQLAAENERLDQFYGTIVIEGRLRPDEYEETKAALDRGVEGVDAMPRRLLRCVPRMVLYDNRKWRDDLSLIEAYLNRVERDGGYSSFFRSLWTHYLLTFEDRDPATIALAQFLQRHVDNLHCRLGAITRKYDLLDPGKGPFNIARAVFNGSSLSNELNSIGLSLGQLRLSSLIVVVLECIGRLLKTEPDNGDPVALVRALLENEVRDVILQAPTQIEHRNRATRTLIEGLVDWQEKAEGRGVTPEPVLSLVLDLNRDPRFSANRWHGIVGAEAIAAVEAWLSRQTIDAFFRVVNNLQVDRRDMWDERRKYWHSYLPFIRRAWLIVGAAAVPLAHREGVRFGNFAGAARDHCGLLMQIDDLMVLEMNKMGRAILWKDGAVPQGGFPTMYDEQAIYDRRKIGMYVSDREEWMGAAIGLRHIPPDGWQRKFADHIQQNTSRYVRPGGY
jgi:hypothetical protein